jgi:hypothetical protein
MKLLSSYDSKYYFGRGEAALQVRLASVVEDVMEEVERIARRRKYMREALWDVITNLNRVKKELLSIEVKE